MAAAIDLSAMIGVATEEERAIKRAAAAFFQSRQPTIAQFGMGGDAFTGNVRGVGIGLHETEGRPASTSRAIRVYVRAKLPAKELSEKERIPANFDGVPTDVVEVGDIMVGHAPPSGHRFSRLRPTWGGISIGHHLVNAGTLGCFVTKGGVPHVLSNNHILARNNHAQIGDAIVQPGPKDGGALPGDKIAALADFEPIRRNGTANLMDAAIARLTDAEFDPEILGIGKVNPSPMPVAVHQSVMKHGRTTGLTFGLVVDVSADIQVGLNPGTAAFEEQIGIKSAYPGPFSAGGDSGSLIVDAVSRRPVGLLFAGTLVQTFANPIDLVLRRFGVTIE